MTMELDFPLTFNFASLYLDKLEVYIFSRWRIVFTMSCKIFMNFVKILKLLWIFEVIVKKIHFFQFQGIFTDFKKKLLYV